MAGDDCRLRSNESRRGHVCHGRQDLLLDRNSPCPIRIYMVVKGGREAMTSGARGASLLCGDLKREPPSLRADVGAYHAYHAYHAPKVHFSPDVEA
jgi:hypothetical protein